MQRESSLASARPHLLLALLSAALCLPPAGAAFAEAVPVQIASGLPGGTYRAIYAANLEKRMRGWKIYYLPSSGSGENLDLLASGKADIAFAQADVYAERLAGNSARYEQLMVVGKLADECVYIAHRRDGPVLTLPQLGQPVSGRPAKIAVGAERGGMNGTWRYLTVLNPELGNARVDFTGDTLALNQLAVGVFDAVGWVTDPQNYDHKMLRAARDNGDLQLMDLTDERLLAPLPDGTRVYTPRKVKLTGSWNAKKIQTICTSAMVFMRSDADKRLLNKVSDTISLERDRIVPPRD